MRDGTKVFAIFDGIIDRDSLVEDEVRDLVVNKLCICGEECEDIPSFCIQTLPIVISNQIKLKEAIS